LPFYRQDLDGVEPDRVGRSGDRVLNTRAPGSTASARVHPENVAPGAVKPGEDDDLLTNSNVLERLLHGRLEVPPRGRRGLASLFGCRLPIGQR
jgi:hypothetical protein